MSTTASQTFFTSDTHFGHKAALGFGRDSYFQDLEHHDLGLIALWNQTVGPNDTAYHLGDLSFHKRDRTREILSRLNGKIHVIKGNHDSTKDLDAFEAEGLIEGWDHMARISVITNAGHNVKKADQVKQVIVLCHYPLLVWDQAHRGAWHLHGHCHNNLQASPTTRIDVGVDGWAYRPVSFEEIAKSMEGREYVALDHHEPKPVLVGESGPELVTLPDGQKDRTSMRFTQQFDIDKAVNDWIMDLFRKSDASEVGVEIDNRKAARHLRTCSEASISWVDASDANYECDTGCDFMKLETLIACHHGSATKFEYGEFGYLNKYVDQIGRPEDKRCEP